MKVLVTGATGFIGSHLVEELTKRGYTVTCLVRKTSSLEWIEGLDVKVVYGDCEDRESLNALKLDGFSFIFHIAGLTKSKRAEDFYKVNAKGTENLINMTAERCSSLKRVVYLSSLSAVGPSLNGKPVNEDTLPQPVSEYGKSKLEGEFYIQRYKDTVPITIIRPPAVYGPRDRDLYIFYKMLKRGIFPYWGICYYSLLYVDDLIRGLISSAESEEAVGETFFLSDGNVYSNIDIADAISRAVGSRPVKLKLPNRLLPLIADIGGRMSRKVSIINKDKVKELCHSKWICDSSKAGRKFGFFPKITIKEGVAWTANWYRLHQWL